MKILAISCSPRSNGNTVAILEEVLHGAQDEKADVELYSVSGKTIQPCDGCRSCANTARCHITDDMQELYEKIYGKPPSGMAWDAYRAVSYTHLTLPTIYSV